jgi:DNA-binding HxlR family transcriptional regulator
MEPGWFFPADGTPYQHPFKEFIVIDFSQLDKVIHEKGRLSIMTLLAAKAEWSFQDLKSQLQMSDGNLITHLRTLFKAGYLSQTKEIDGRPQTRYSLTKGGREAFEKYLGVLEAIVQLGKL